MADGIPKSRLKPLQVSLIRENPSALRTVNRQSDEYQELVDSVRQRGIMNPIVVREVKDTNGEMHYGLVDGLHRFTAAQDAGLTEVPCNVISMSDGEVLEAQLITNMHKIDTKPVEYSKQLMRILSANPLMTIAELSKRLSVSPAWLTERLGLVKLDEKIAKLVDEGKVGLSNAYALAKLPVEEQNGFVERAMTMQPQEFIPTVNARVKEVRDAKRQGRDPNKSGFTPVPHMRKIGEINDEVERREYAKALVNEVKPPTTEEAFVLGLQWVRHMDPLSIEAARAKDEERRRKDESERIERKKQRETERAEKARETAAEIHG